MMSLNDIAAVFGHEEDDYEDDMQDDFMNPLAELFCNEDGTAMSVDQIMAVVNTWTLQTEELRNRIDDLEAELYEKDQITQRYEAELHTLRSDQSTLESKMNTLVHRNRLYQHEAMEAKEDMYEKEKDMTE